MLGAAVPTPSQVSATTCRSPLLETLAALITNFIHAILHITLMLGSCAFFSKTFIDVSGSSAKDVSMQLREQQVST